MFEGVAELRALGGEAGERKLQSPRSLGRQAQVHDAGIRVIVKEALANGRLSPRGGNGALDAVAARLGTTSDAIALAAALARPWADTVLLGAASVDTLASDTWPLSIRSMRRPGVATTTSTPRRSA